MRFLIGVWKPVVAINQQFIAQSLEQPYLLGIPALCQ